MKTIKKSLIELDTEDGHERKMIKIRKTAFLTSVLVAAFSGLGLFSSMQHAYAFDLSVMSQDFRDGYMQGCTDGEGDNNAGNEFKYHYDLSGVISDWSNGYEFGYYDGYAAYDHQC